MRIYEGSPRQDWEEVLRSVGADLDDRGMRGLVFLETDTGFIIQGTAVSSQAGSGRDESMGTATRVTMTVQDEDIGKFMDDALARRGQEPDPTPSHYESQLRVIGRYLDEQKPRDLFFFEIEGAYVISLSVPGPTGLRQTLVEFTADDVADLIAKAPALRRGSPAKEAPG